MKSTAAVLEAFNQPLSMREFDSQPPAPGEVIVKLSASGVCGSDVHMWKGMDPRTPLPMILGHEGIGRVAALGGDKTDLFGAPLNEGDLVMWERGVMCGKCHTCVALKQPALCPHRKTYGISYSCEEAPYLLGNYSEYIHLKANCHFIKIAESVDPAVMVPASCSGATAAHAVEVAGVKPGDTVVIQGPGPVGLFTSAFAVNSGADRVIMLGMEADRRRLEMAQRFGATDTFILQESTPAERLGAIRAMTHGRGADVVFECTGHPGAIPEGIELVAPLGAYALVGISTPVGEAAFKPFEHLIRKNARLLGVWVSDTSHLIRAIRLVESARYPFESIVDHRCPLDQATDALEKMRDKKVMKAVIVF